MQIGNRQFDFENSFYIMGILNVTPDSFSDGGKFNTVDEAVVRVQTMIEEGADIIDIGGESTRPGHDEISTEEEIHRVVPVIEAIRANFDIPISIDTSKSAVAEASILAGANMVNDVWGCKKDPQMASIIAKHNIPCCLMHNKEQKKYTNLLGDVCTELSESIQIALEAGVLKEQILIDPGIGFGKTLEQNLAVMKDVAVLQTLGYPILLGTSRKSMIGLTLDLSVEDRVEGTLATTVYGMENGCHIFRVHDIKENARAIKMIERIRNGK